MNAEDLRIPDHPAQRERAADLGYACGVLEVVGALLWRPARCGLLLVVCLLYVCLAS